MEKLLQANEIREMGGLSKERDRLRTYSEFEANVKSGNSGYNIILQRREQRKDV